MSNIFIINVGVNASHGLLRSPVFKNGAFEFIPIPEIGRRVSCPGCPTLPCYKNLKSHNGLNLLEFIPEAYHNVRVHDDPEFRTFTYGDYPTFSARAANLKKASIGDFVFFLARLVRFKNKVFGECGFFLIGFFEIGGILKEVRAEPEASVLEAFKNNAHVQRAIFDPKFWDGFWVFKGSTRSVRFEHAIPFDREFCEAVLTDAEGKELTWPRHRSELQVIGSYTRSCRIIEKEDLRDTFWKIIGKRKRSHQE